MWLKCGVILIFASLASNVEGNCNMPGDKEWENKDFLFDVQAGGTNIKTYKIENIKDVKLGCNNAKWDIHKEKIELKLSVTPEFYNYTDEEKCKNFLFDFTNAARNTKTSLDNTEDVDVCKYVHLEINTDETELIFSVTPEFDNYIKNEDTARTRVKIHFTCADSSTENGDLLFDVEQKNFVKPEINKETLEFDLKMPILEQTVIPNVAIKATDLNLGDMKLVFSVVDECSDLFQFDTTAKDKKIYSTHLKTKDKIVDLSNSMSCKIKVTNNKGEEDTATIKLNVDTANSVAPNPIFLEPLYEATYIDEAEKHSLQHDDIKLEPTIYEAHYEIYSEYKEFFSFNGIKLILKENLPATAFDEKHHIAVTIEATYDTAKAPGKTIVIINSPKKLVDQIPIFKKPIYTTDINADYKINSITIDFQEATEDNLQVEIDTDYKEYFHWDKNTNLLASTNALPKETFDNVDYITVTIEAFYDKTKGSGKTVVNINGPEKKLEDLIPVFTKPIYTTDVKDDYKIDPITIEFQEETKDNLQFEIETAYEDYFNWDKNTNLLSSTKALPKETFENVEYITVTIEAFYDKSKGSGKTVVNINGPEKKLEDLIPVFTKPIYTTDVKDDYKIDPITIEFQEATKDNLQFEIETVYEDYFNWDKNTNLLSSTKALPTETFDNVDYITVTIEAFYDKTTGSGKTVVIINGPEKEGEQNHPIPVFKKPIYTTDVNGDYKIDPITIEFQEKTEDNVQVEVETDYKNYFTWDKNTNLLSSTNSLPKETFDKVDYITVTIEAFYDKTKGSGKTVVIINGPEKKLEDPIPMFKKPIYTTDVNDDYKIDPITIEFQEKTEDNVQVEVETDYKNYFTWDKNTNLLSSTNSLPKETFDKVDYITVTIEAFYDKTKGSGKTVVIINGPEKKLEDPIPMFKKPIYTTDVNDDYKIDPITIEFQEKTEDNVQVEVETDYKNYFTWDKNTNLLSSTNALPKETFDKVDYITVTIEAFYDKTKGSGKTVVIINGPEKDGEQNHPIPVFKKPSYTTDANDDYNIDPITIEFQETTKDNLQVEIETDFKDYFNWDKNTNLLSSIKALPKETFAKVDYITVTIEAFYDKTKGSGKTVVIINGPEKDGEQNHPIPMFKKPSYTTDANDDYNIDPITIEFQETTKDNLQVEIETDFKDYFNWDKNTNLLSSIKALPKETFAKVDYITVTIEAFYDKTKGSGKTVVIINGPEKDGEQNHPIPVFKKPSYTTDANDDYNIDPITIEFQETTKDNLQVEIETDFKDYLNWDKNTNLLSSIKALPKETFAKVDYITVTIEAFYDKTKGSGKTVVIINGPEKDGEQNHPIPVFKKPSYTTDANDDYNIDPITIEFQETTKDNLQVEIETDFKDYFNWDKNTNLLSSIKALPKETFAKVDYITVTIEAFYDKTKGSGKTVVIINGPEKDGEQNHPIPVFKKPSYTTDANDDYNIDPITIEFQETTKDNLQVEIETDFKDYFNWDKNTNLLSSIKALSKETFAKVDYITVTIEAFYDKTKGSGKTVVIINGPEKDGEQNHPIPVFKKPSYTTDANDDYNIDPITIEFQEATKDNLQVEIETDFKDYFNWDKNTNLLSSIKALPKETFAKVDYITVTIEAFYDKTKGSGKTVVIINGPEKKGEQNHPIPVFKKPSYTTDANDDYNIDPITIEFQEATKDNLQVEIETEFKEYFNWDKNTKLFSSTKALPKDTFDKVEYITVTIEAFYDKTKGSGKTVVIINGPDKDGEQQHPIPIFKKPIYTTDANDDYKIDSITIEFQEVTQDNLQVEVETDYKDYFTWDKNTNIFSSINALPKETFDKVDYITVTIEAFYDKTKGSGKTVVIINGPEKDGEQQHPIPIFKKPIYTTDANDDYKIDSITIEFQEKTEDNLQVEIEPAYTNYFTWDKNTNLLSSTKALSKETFDKVDYITVTIEAFYDKTKGSGKTVVIINGPEKDGEQQHPIPIFKKPIYTTDANEDYKIDPITIEFQEPTKDNLQVEVETDFKDYFNWDKNTNLLSSIKTLPKEIFDKVDYITVTIEAFYSKTKGSGKTVVIINGPEKDGEKNHPIPVFKKPIYRTDANDDYKIDPITIEFQEKTEDNLQVEIETDYKDYITWDENTNLLSSTNALPKETFVKVDYITVTIEAFYDKSKGSGKTVVIINGPEKEGEQNHPIPVFKKPIHTTDINDNYKIDPITIEFQEATQDNLHVEVETDYKNYFSWDKNTNLLSSTNALPKETFDKVDYITLTIEAFYDKTKGSGKTVVIINGPEDDDDEKQIPIFENPFYRTQYKNDDTMNPIVIKLKSSTLNPTFEIESQYKNIFKLENDKFELKAKLPKDTFDNVNYITVTIRAFYDTLESSGRAVVIIDSPKQAAPKPKVWYEENLDVFDKDNKFTGLIGTFTAKTESSEIILYDILKTEPNIKDKLEYNTNGELKVTEALLDMPYFQITLRATGKESSSADTMDIVLVMKQRINEDAEFEYSLVVESVPENSKQTKIVSGSSKVQFKIADEDSNEWFEIVKGDLFLKKNIDRENIKLKNMLKSQVKTKLEAYKISYQKSSNISMNELYQTSPKVETNDQTCIDIQTIPYSRDIMYVVVTIEDENDNKPKFVEENPLVIGYPSPALAEFIAPPYLVKVTATDEDIGINAKVKYSVDKIFNIDAENGIIYPRDNLDSDTEFTVSATDKDGAADGQETELKIKVKILEAKHISVITVNNMAYFELDDLIVNLGKETNTKVKYLTSTVLPKTEPAKEEKSLRQTRADDEMPVLRIVMYALDLDDNEVVAAADLKKLIEDSDLSDLVDVKEYVAPDEPSNDSGWVAAVSTLSVLLGIVLIGVVAGYIFYIRPRLTPGGSIKYEKHTNSEPGHTSMTPVEAKMETNNIYARRPTGFPVGFTRTDLSDDDDDLDSVKDEKTYEEIDVGVKESNEDQERRKSVVKFDTNVTEIEIESSEL